MQHGISNSITDFFFMTTDATNFFIIMIYIESWDFEKVVFMMIESNVSVMRKLKTQDRIRAGITLSLYSCHVAVLPIKHLLREK